MRADSISHAHPLRIAVGMLLGMPLGIAVGMPPVIAVGMPHGIALGNPLVIAVRMPVLTIPVAVAHTDIDGHTRPQAPFARAVLEPAQRGRPANHWLATGADRRGRGWPAGYRWHRYGGGTAPA